VRAGLSAVSESRWYGSNDPMLNGSWKAAEQLPRRVVVELSPAEYRALEQACSGRPITAAELVRLVALRLARAV
jgi:hypothetical protein